MKLPTRQTHKRFHMRGATLIEVMVSVFLLTFGVLGLMAAQIRSVASISEAESRTTVSQAAEMLAEGMLANPTVHEVNGRAVRRYTNYTTRNNQLQNVDMSAELELPKPLWGNDWQSNSDQTAKNISKQDLADSQIAMFQYLLNQTPNAESMQYVICEEVNNPPLDMTIDANGNVSSTNCSGAGADGSTVIKVAWSTRPAKDKEKDGSPAKRTVYTYLLQVQE